MISNPFEYLRLCKTSSCKLGPITPLIGVITPVTHLQHFPFIRPFIENSIYIRLVGAHLAGTRWFHRKILRLLTMRDRTDLCTVPTSLSSVLFHGPVWTFWGCQHNGMCVGSGVTVSGGFSRWNFILTILLNAKFVVHSISRFSLQFCPATTSWWFPPHLKNMLVKLGSIFPNFRGEHKKRLSCYHPDYPPSNIIPSHNIIICSPMAVTSVGRPWASVRLASILGLQPSRNKVFSNQNKGSFGFQVYIYNVVLWLVWWFWLRKSLGKMIQKLTIDWMVLHIYIYDYFMGVFASGAKKIPTATLSISFFFF